MKQCQLLVDKLIFFVLFHRFLYISHDCYVCHYSRYCILSFLFVSLFHQNL